MHNDQRIRAFREAGNIQRAHTIPHRGSYTNAEHQYNVLSLLLVLHPNPSPELMKAALWHDVGERWTGDVPGSIKYVLPDVRFQMDELEEEFKERLGVPVNLSHEDKQWLRACDKIELWLWACDEAAMGNRNAEDLRNCIQQDFQLQRVRLPAPCAEFVRGYIWMRGSDEHPGA